MKYRLALVIAFFCTIQFANSQNTWDSIADFGGGQRQRAVSFSLVNKGYVATGLDTADRVHNDLWEYNPVTGTWAQLANMPGVARRNAVAFTIGNKAYVGTGVDSSVAPAGNILNDFYEYDPLNNTWTQVANYPGQASGVYFATGFNAGGKGYVCGGKLGSDWYTSKLYEYKPSVDTWAERAQFPGGTRYQMVSFSVNGFAYLGLGADEDIYRKDWWKYNPGSNEWNQMGDFYGAERAASVSFVLNEIGYIAMGTDGGYEDDVWEYNDGFDTWIMRENFPGKGRKFACSFTIGDTAYVGLGKAYNGGKRSFNKYYPAYLNRLKSNVTKDFDVYPSPIKNQFAVSFKGDYAKVEIRDLSMNLIAQFKRESIYSINQKLIESIYFIILKNNQNKTVAIKKVYVK